MVYHNGAVGHCYEICAVMGLIDVRSCFALDYVAGIYYDHDKRPILIKSTGRGSHDGIAGGSYPSAVEGIAHFDPAED